MEEGYLKLSSRIAQHPELGAFLNAIRLRFLELIIGYRHISSVCKIECSAHSLLAG